MAQYIIRTDKNRRHTYILKAGDHAETIGMAYTDFHLRPGNRDISSEDIVEPLSNKTIAQARLHQEGNIIAVSLKGKEISAYTKQGEYKENGIIIPYRKMMKDVLLSRQKYEALKNAGLTHAYFLGENSSLHQVLCFEKDSDISGIIQAKGADDISALKGLSLVLAQRVENQEFIFEFMRN